MKMKKAAISATSTPFRVAVKSSVLKEKQIDQQPKKEILGRKFQKENENEEKKTRKSSPKAAKENEKQKPKPYFKSPHHRVLEKRDTQRRQQALEAMQILELRRQRLTQSKLAEKMEELTLKPPNEGRDELMEKKRLEAKRLKEKRILAHLAEQEAAKKKKAEFTARKPRLGSSKSFPVFQPRQKILYKPHKLPQVEEVHEATPAPPVRPKIIKYTKDELRALNPYGYYFM